MGADIVVHQLDPLPIMSASHVSTSEDNPSAWNPVPHVGDSDEFWSPHLGQDSHFGH